MDNRITASSAISQISQQPAASSRPSAQAASYAKKSKKVI
jgi:hypothetical protein